MTSSGVPCEVCVLHFNWIEGESEWIYSKSWKNKITILSIILKIV